MWKSGCGLFGFYVFGFGILFGFIGVRRDFAGGLAEEIEDEKSGSEEEITRKLGFDGEAVGVGEAEGAVGATGTEEGGFAGEATGVE